jgi:hypothetical protein
MTYINVTEILLRNRCSIFRGVKNSVLLQDVWKDCAAHSQLLFKWNSGLLPLMVNYHPSPNCTGAKKAWSHIMPLHAFTAFRGTVLFHK